MMAINRLKGLLGTVPKTDDVVASLFESPAGNTTGSPFRACIYSQQIVLSAYHGSCPGNVEFQPHLSIIVTNIVSLVVMIE